MNEKTIVILQGIMDDVKNLTPSPQAIEGLTEGAKSGSTWDNLMQLIGLVFLLIIILIATYYTSRFVGGIKLGQMKNSNFTVIDNYRISQNKVIQIVKIANKYIVIAISKDTISYITELDEAEVLMKEMNSGQLQSFKQTLDKLRNNNK